MKKSVTGDKIATRRGPQVLSLARVPLVRGAETVEAFRQQQLTVSLMKAALISSLCSYFTRMGLLSGKGAAGGVRESYNVCIRRVSSICI
jgi:hypothetical protein